MGCAETCSSSVCVQLSSAKTKELASIRPACQCWQRIHAWRMLSILSNIFLRNYELFNNSLWLYLTKVLSLVTLTCIYVKIYPLNLWPPHALTNRFHVRFTRKRQKTLFLAIFAWLLWENCETQKLEIFSIQYWCRNLKYTVNWTPCIMYKYLNSKNGRFNQMCLCYSYENIQTKCAWGIYYPRTLKF